MKPLYNHICAIADLEMALRIIQLHNESMPHIRVEVRPIRKQLKKARELAAHKEAIINRKG